MGREQDTQKRRKREEEREKGKIGDRIRQDINERKDRKEAHDYWGQDIQEWKEGENRRGREKKKEQDTVGYQGAKGQEGGIRSVWLGQMGIKGRKEKGRIGNRMFQDVKKRKDRMKVKDQWGRDRRIWREGERKRWKEKGRIGVPITCINSWLVAWFQKEQVMLIRIT